MKSINRRQFLGAAALAGAGMTMTPSTVLGNIAPMSLGANDKRLEKYRKLRTAKLNKPRQLIHNNDGNEAIYYPVNEKYSASNFLSKRSSGLIGTDATTISYCTIAAGFGYFTHNTKVGEVLVNQGFDYEIRENDRNITAEMIAEGTDPLQVTIEFARKNGFEIFWSNRMNDNHDSAHKVDKPYFLWTKFKENNPQYLFGKVGEGFLGYGWWSSVDFNHQAVRDLCVQFFKEICDNYDVDGVEMDFFRHPEIFGTVAKGGIATDEQLDMLTDMVRQIRKVTEEAGMKKGNPILLITRVPTSPEYAKRMGIDYNRWIDEGLVDIVIGSCYYQQNFWAEFAKLGEGKNVKMYASLSDSRVRNQHPSLVRKQNSVFRAQAAAAWEAGIDGLYSFNEFQTRIKYLYEIGNPSKLKKTNNLYFVTYRDYSAETWLKGGNDFYTISRLSPYLCPQKFTSESFDFKIEIGDEASQADVYAILYADNIASNDLTVKINGSLASFKNVTEDGLYIFEVNPKSIKPGINNLYVKGEGEDDSRVLKDAAIFFCRDKNDLEMRQLIALCR